MTSGNDVPIFILQFKGVTVIGNIGQGQEGMVTPEGKELGEIEISQG